ncbi:MAG: hypothetical protein KBF88_03840 [Polyangiaceae bacterium]|nr:hypothetical protein [Polyangiaceae bacterium]
MLKAIYGTSFYVLFGIIGVTTCGIGLLIVVFMRSMWIDSVDNEGVTTRSGARYLWSNLTKIDRVTMVAGASRVAGVGTLYFGNKKVIINTALVSNATEIVQFVQARVGQPVIG